MRSAKRRSVSATQRIDKLLVPIQVHVEHILTGVPGEVSVAFDRFEEQDVTVEVERAGRCPIRRVQPPFDCALFDVIGDANNPRDTGQ